MAYLMREFESSSHANVGVNIQKRRVSNADDEFQGQATVSRTRLLFEERQNNNKQSWNTGQKTKPVILPDIRLHVDKRPEVDVIGMLRAKNKWMRQRGNLRRMAEQKVIEKLRKDRKRTFMTQLEGQAEFEQSHSWPEAHKTSSHYYWSTIPSANKLEERFRYLIRTAMKILHWHDAVKIKNTKAYQAINREQMKKHERKESKFKSATRVIVKLMAQSQKYVVDQKEKMQFNVTRYQRDATRAGGLSNKVKAILKIDSLNRNRKEILVIQEAITRLQCFDRVVGVNTMRDKRVKKELARSVMIDHFEKGRIVIKQGHRGVSFYFIVSGSTGVYVTSFDKETGNPVTRLVQVLGPGNTFGELALMHQVKRTATVITHEKCELLRIDRPEFEAIMSTAKKIEWTSRYRFLKSLPAFSTWPKEELRACNNGCRIVDYNDNTVILGNTKVQQDVVHFIYSGECIVVKEIFLKKTQITTSGKYTNYKFAPRIQMSLVCSEDMELHDERGRRKQHLYQLERKLLTVCKLVKSSYFGVGENLTDAYIIASGTVECLQIPINEFMIRPNLYTTIAQLAEKLNECLPSDRKLFYMYTCYKKWRDYCVKTAKDAIKVKKGKNNTAYHDVPQHYRMLNYNRQIYDKEED